MNMKKPLRNNKEYTMGTHQVVGTNSENTNTGAMREQWGQPGETVTMTELSTEGWGGVRWGRVKSRGIPGKKKNSKFRVPTSTRSVSPQYWVGLVGLGRGGAGEEVPSGL